MFNKQDTQTNLNRRSWLKKIGVGALAGAAALMTTKKAAAQTNIYAYWTHGNVARAQFPELLDQVEYRGTGAVFKGQPGTENWFHVPLGHAVFLNFGRATVFGANLQLETSGGVFLREIKLFDGNREIGATSDLSETGVIFQRVDIFDPEFVAGMGISARVEFSSQTTRSEVEIIAAGVDLMGP